MAANKTGRNLRGRHARSGGSFGSHRRKAGFGPVDQPGPGRTGAADRAGEAGEVRLESELRFISVLKDCGGRTRVGDSEGGRGLGRLGAEELTADEIVNRWPEKELADLLYRGADEHDSRRIARAILRARPIRDTAHLATVVAGARKQWGRQKLHPATKTFLALRIAVNRELEALGQFLFRTPATMNSGARFVLLTYHSGEDRMVKEAFKEGERQGTLKILTKHVIRPSEAEERANPRSRSAKLRCAERV